MPNTTTYRVVAGDTLFKIAQKFKTSVDAIKLLNGLTSNNLKIGQTLSIQTSGAANTQTPTAPASPANNSDTTYRVVSGDTLSKIARIFNTSVSALKSLNGLKSNDLRIGQVLRVPTPVVTNTPPPITPPPPVNANSNIESARQEYVPEIVQNVGFRRFLLRIGVSGGSVITATLRDNVQSIHTRFSHGILYGGQSKIELDTATIQSVGVTPSVAKALQFVSTHEGQFDAINSYDQAIFSYGFIQFAGASAVGASLNRVMASMESNAPVVFQRVFQRFGIDNEGGVITVLDNNGNKLKGDAAWLFIQRDVRLYGPFIQAGFEPLLVKEQIRMANELYVQPALNTKLNVMLGTVRVSIPRLVDIINSEAALTAVIAIAINQGVGGMARLFAAAISNVAARSNITNQLGLQGINEQAVLEDIMANSTDVRIHNRINDVLRSGLNFA